MLYLQNCIIYIATAISVLSCNSASITEKTKAVLIFCDVTSSLNRNEIEKVTEIASTTLDELPEGSYYSLFPININSDRPSLMLKGTVPVLDNKRPSEKAGYEELKNRRKIFIKEKIDSLYTKINPIQPTNRSCILNTIPFIQNYRARYLQNHTATFDFRVLYISDMIEDCDNTILGRPIHLDSLNISSEISMIDSFDFKFDLSLVNIEVIIPPGIYTKPDSIKKNQGSTNPPRELDLQKYWGKFFEKCNANFIWYEWAGPKPQNEKKDKSWKRFFK